MFNFEDWGEGIGHLGGWLNDLGEFAQDASSIVEAVQSVTGDGIDYRTPGIIPLGAGVGDGQVYGPRAPTDVNGLVLLGLAAVAAYLVLKRG